MHRSKEKRRIQRMAMFLCLLLWMDLSMQVVLATSNSQEYSYAEIEINGGQGNHKIKEENQKQVVQVNWELWEEPPTTMTIVPTETGVYHITLKGQKAGSTGDADLRYFLQNIQSGGLVRLAATYENGAYYPITRHTSDGSTEIDVVLEAGTAYGFQISTEDARAIQSEYSLSIERVPTTPGVLAVTNIPSSAVSNLDSYYDLTNLPERSQLESVADGLKLVEYTDEEVQYYTENGVEEEDKEQKGSWLEGLLVDIILVIGDVFLWIVEQMLGAKGELTIDNIVFNRYSQTVIDLSRFGGMSLGGVLSASGKGVFQDDNVLNVVTILYGGLKTLAYLIYIVMFLAIGIKILLSVGGKDQKRFMKYLEYWFAGLLILTILPYFFSAIPAVSNSIIAMMEPQARAISSKYTIEEIWERLGNRSVFLGEDASVVELQNAIDDRIADLNDKIDGNPRTREEAQASIDSNIDASVSLFANDLIGTRGALEEKVKEITNIVDANYLDWTEEIEDYYDEKIRDLRQYVFENSAVSSGLEDQIMNDIPQQMRNSQALIQQVQGVIAYIKKNAPDWAVREAGYNQRMVALESAMRRQHLDNFIPACREAIERGKRSYVLYGRAPAFQNLEKLFHDYKDAVIQEEISELEEIKTDLSRDVMTMLKTKAAEDNRLIYAIAWAILLFQMFAILFLYYKRIITILFLVVSFPIIMAFYVIDRVGDGKAQSFEAWLKEFIANIVIQILHGAVYLVLINSAIQICDQDPEKNWFILLLAVCFLFPGERILRSILGLNVSTLTNLRTNWISVAAGTHAVAAMATGSARLAANTVKDIKRGDVPGSKFRKEAEKERERKAEEQKKRQEESLQAAERRRKLRLAREARIRRDGGNLLDRGLHIADTVGDRMDSVKKKISGFKIAKGASAIADGAKSAWNSKAATYGRMSLKRAGKVARRSFGVTMGAVEGMESFSKEGALSGAFTAVHTAGKVGGFQAPKASRSTATSPAFSGERGTSTASKFDSHYENGSRVEGTAIPTAGNIRPNVRAANTANEQARRTTKVNLETHINDVTVHGDTPDRK